MNIMAIFLLAFALGGICGLLIAAALRANRDDTVDDDTWQDMKTESEVVRGLKCYQRMGELDKELACRMEHCPYWGEDDTGTSLCNVPQIISDAIAELEAGRDDRHKP